MDQFISIGTMAMVLFSLCCMVHLGKETVKGINWLVRHLLYEMENKENTGL